MSAIKRVLCLHGYSQNALRLKQDMGPITKALNNMEFVYIDAPHIATEPRNDQKLLQGKPYGWWNMSTARVWQDTQKSVQYLLDIMNTQGPFHGILGFSQGAAMIPVLLSILNYKNLKHITANTEKELQFERQFIDFLGPLKTKVDSIHNKEMFKFAILSGGFAPGKKVCLRLINSTPEIPVPSMHIIGKTDSVISNKQSIELSQLFKNPEFVLHTGGHYVPFTKEYTSLYKNFIPKL
ncbi:hypothetical protein BB561_000293 [Smittium simulii]|uniref:Serine hydrolase domain-containing protein n=1 Tax=Smittium simulii TaxID=133385 RepID=A0A2T9YZT2_9FUNG|nr:hypothetical protein BB561_000293 [Smittium simulii]